MHDASPLVESWAGIRIIDPQLPRNRKPPGVITTSSARCYFTSSSGAIVSGKRGLIKETGARPDISNVDSGPGTPHSG